jgi:hypothetical protein
MNIENTKKHIQLIKQASSDPVVQNLIETIEILLIVYQVQNAQIEETNARLKEMGII